MDRSEIVRELSVDCLGAVHGRGLSMGCPWDVRGLSGVLSSDVLTGCSRDVHELLVEHPRIVRRLSVGCPWAVYRLCEDYPWAVRELFATCLWDLCEFSMG